MYNDDYPTCEETYATLRIYHDHLEPDEISNAPSLVPSDLQRKGDVLSSGRVVLPTGGWCFSSKGYVTSKDTRRHVAWVLDQLEPNKSNLLSLQDRGYEMDIFCFWVSASGHGGPELDHELMQRLASFRLSVGFDLYF
jgi:hypothetical protein